MGFLQSAINQVGRDMGRVVSNAIFKDRHAVPIRRAKSFNNSTQNQVQRPQNSKALPIQQVKNEFNKAIDFKTGYRPTTLISKLGGAFVIIKNEARAFIEDGYLDEEESQQLFQMMIDFNHKCSDVEDVIGFTEDKDSKVYQQLDNILQTTQDVFKDVLKTSIQACDARAKAYDNTTQDIFIPTNFGRFLGLYLIWFPKYAKGGEKKVTNAVIANILDLVTFTFPITRTVLFIMALVDYSAETKKGNHLLQSYKTAAAKERERAKTYRKFFAESP